MVLPTAFFVSAFALLCLPGPTNTLLAASGATYGIRRSLILMPAEICGYLVTIALLTEVVVPLLSRHPALPVVFKLIAVAYILKLSWHMWDHAGARSPAQAGPIGPRKMLGTALLTPKTLIFALIIFPPGGLEQRLPAFAGLTVVLAITGFGWICFGHLVARSAGRHASPRRISRITAVALLVFASVLFASAVSSLL